MARVDGNIPDNVVKILFAEDLVSYVMLSYDTSFNFVKRYESFRNLVYNAFSENVRNAVDFLKCQFHMVNSFKFEILEATRMTKASSFLKIAEQLREKFFSKGFEARKFLYYCAHVSSMAGIFYSFGTTEAPHIAADAIVKSLSEYPTECGAWDTVNAIATELCNMAVRCEYTKCPVDSLVREHCKNKSPICYSPGMSNDEDDNIFDFEKGVLHHLALDEFIGIDNEWKNMLLPLLVEQDYSSSDESNEGNLISPDLGPRF